VVRDDLGLEASRSLPRVVKGTQKDEDWVIKVEPGVPFPISAFVDIGRLKISCRYIVFR